MLRLFTLATYQITFPGSHGMLCPGSQVGLRLTLALFGMVVMVTALPIMLLSFLFNVLTAVIFLNVLSGKKNLKLVPKDLV